MNRSRGQARPSLKDVAARAGVSPRTVSNVVNDFPYVAADTRERVRTVLDEMGYRPNAAARSLRQGRSGLIGLVVPELDSPYFGELAALTVRAAETRGWVVLADQTDGDAERERRMLDGMRLQLVDGLIFSPWALSPAELRGRVDAVPLVLLGEREPGGLMDRVAVDNVSASREAVEHLVGSGRRRIALIGAQPNLPNNTAAERLTGYRAALRAAGMTPTPHLEMPVEALHRADGATAMRALLDHDPPDAVFCVNDQLALGALRVAYERGLRVPDDLAICGFDDIEDGRYSTPALTTVAPAKEQIAERALDCLAKRLGPASVSDPYRDIVAEHRLVVRETT
ncbi:LacI family DNA-binding transcriptional regulator [Haloactinopolyspora alba]|uniref:LacI family DNA-binding transcriptional regulator n=1 Tax=Haloactinopolyspora alba TaxID=648780 RepID=UPI00197AE3E0|nr:LacI family DNA-binding transcriptional regulator [Haloactinopolyspora alba]